MSSITSPNNNTQLQSYFIIGTLAISFLLTTKAAATTLIDVLNPSKHLIPRFEVDISHLQEGESMFFNLYGKPVLIRHRTSNEIEIARSDERKSLMSSSSSSPSYNLTPDVQRTQRPEWLIVYAVCTHLGCVVMPNIGEHEGGLYCPCHSAQFDASGRVRKGPAVRDLDIPIYTFLTPKKLRFYDYTQITL